MTYETRRVVIYTENRLPDFTKLFIRTHLLCLGIWNTFRARKLLFNCKSSTTMWTITFFSCSNPEKLNCCLELCFELLTIATWTKKSFKTYTASLLQKLQNPPPSLQISFWWEHFFFWGCPHRYLPFKPITAEFLVCWSYQSTTIGP